MLGTWQTQPLAAGKYTLRLMVLDGNNRTHYDHVIVNVVRR